MWNREKSEEIKRERFGLNKEKIGRGYINQAKGNLGILKIDLKNTVIF